MTRLLLFLTAALPFCGCLSVQADSGADRPATPQAPAVDAGSPVECEALRLEIQGLLDGADTSCAAPGDCTVLDADPGCPFGCFHLVNRAWLSSPAHARLEKAGGQWMSRCNPCIYDCDRAPTPGEILCRNGKCVDSRYP